MLIKFKNARVSVSKNVTKSDFVSVNLKFHTGEKKSAICGLE